MSRRRRVPLFDDDHAGANRGHRQAENERHERLPDNRSAQAGIGPRLKQRRDVRQATHNEHCADEDGAHPEQPFHRAFPRPVLVKTDIDTDATCVMM
jgi:hypothetical protein